MIRVGIASSMFQPSSAMGVPAAVTCVCLGISAAPRLEGLMLPYRSSLPATQGEGRRDRRTAVLRERLESCDVLIGVSPAVRRVLKATTPLIEFDLGELALGAGYYVAQSNAFRQADHLVVSCTADAEIYQRVCVEPRIDFSVIPFAIDTGFWCRQAPEADAAERARFGLPEGQKLLVYAGRIIPTKNIHLLFYVLHYVRRLLGKNVGLCLCGRMPSQEYLQDLTVLANHLDIQTGVYWMGNLSAAELASLYRVSDTFITLTTHPDENFGFAPIEAMACGLPVVATAWGGLKDSIRHGETGYTVRTVLTEAGVRVFWMDAVRGVVTILSDHRLQTNMRHSAAQWVRSRYNLPVFTRRIERIAQKCALKARQGGNPPLLLSFVADVVEYNLQLLAENRLDRRTELWAIMEMYKHFPDLYRSIAGSYCTTTADQLPLDVGDKLYHLLPVNTTSEYLQISRNEGPHNNTQVTGLESRFLQHIVECDSPMPVSEIMAATRQKWEYVEFVCRSLIRKGIIGIEGGW